MPAHAISLMTTLGGSAGKGVGVGVEGHGVAGGGVGVDSGVTDGATDISGVEFVV